MSRRPAVDGQPVDPPLEAGRLESSPADDPSAAVFSDGIDSRCVTTERAIELQIDDGDEIGVNAARSQLEPIVWAMHPSDRARLRDLAGPCTDVVALWNCPVCHSPVPRFRRPGRHAVYCTNACKQKAYRHRCIDRNRQMIEIARNPRPRRAHTRDGIHAARETIDVSTGRRDSTGRGVTMCGAFAAMSLDTPGRFGHTRFLATSGPSDERTCQRCVQLSHSPVRDPEDVRRAILDRRRLAGSDRPTAA